MALKPVKVRFLKKDREMALSTLGDCIPPGGRVYFIQMNSHEYDWILVTYRESEPCLFGITRLVAGLINRPYVDGVLRGVQYDSPQILLKELQEVLGYEEPLTYGEFTWL